MFTWLGDSEQSCYIYKTLAPSLVLKTQDQQELCQVFCIVMLPYNRGQEILKTFFAVGQKKIWILRHNMFHMTMGEVSE